jgi:hypothetical protein
VSSSQYAKNVPQREITADSERTQGGEFGETPEGRLERETPEREFGETPERHTRGKTPERDFGETSEEQLTE